MSATRRVPSLLAFSLSLFMTLGTSAGATDVSPLTHRQIPGDFNGDGRLDALFQPLSAGGQGVILLQDGTGRLTVLAQQWDPDYLGVDWSSKGSVITTADLNGDSLDDVLVQPVDPGKTAAVLITDPTAQLLQVAQLIPAGYLGLDWSAAGTQAVPGDFDGDHQKELLMQPARPGMAGGIVHADTAGHLVVVTEALADGFLGRRWNAADVQLYVGDFNGDGRDDLLMQVKSGAPAAAESAYALLLADANGQFTQVNETWNLKDLGADWNPKDHKILIQDANGDGIMDIVVQSTVPNGTNYVFLGNNQGAFIEPAAHWTGNKSAAEVLKAQQKTAPSNGISVVVAQPTSNVVMPPSGSSPTSPSGTQGAKGSATLMTANATGVVDGSGGVSGGTASYSIPIAVPPGIRGMQPSLSLSYSSRGGNGEAGMGWSLSAGSQIHRCPATVAMDGYSMGVTYTAKDRLCLDGQHLVLVSGVYGEEGAVYRTELDSFAKVVGHGDYLSPTSVSTFVVTEKNGHTLTYGANGYRFTAPGAPAPLSWGIYSDLDTYQNSIIYTYTSFSAGEFLVTKIQYTGSGSTAGNREVDFAYQTRVDMSSQYLAGGITRQTQLLSTITTQENGQVVRTYNLSYNTSAATGRSILADVQECGGTGSSQQCLAPTQLAWSSSSLSGGNPGPSFSAPTLYSPEANPSGGELGILDALSVPVLDQAGDFDGDGHRELMMMNANGNTLMFVNGAAQVQYTAGLPSVYNNGGYLSADADFSNNGAADLFGFVSGQNASFIATPWVPSTTGNGGTWGAVQFLNVPFSFGAANPLAMDVDGDGLADIVTSIPTPGGSANQFDLYVYLNKTTDPSSITFDGGHKITTLSQYQDPITGTTLSCTFKSAGDMDGNGHPDLFIFCSQSPNPVGIEFIGVDGSGNLTYNYRSMTSLGLDQQSFASVLMVHNGSLAGYFMDINGDGLPDYLFACSNGHWCYQLNTGNSGGTLLGATVDTGAVFNMYSTVVGTAQNAAVVGDLFGDGRQELVYPNHQLHQYCVFRVVNGSDETPCGGTSGVPDRGIYQYNYVSFAPVMVGNTLEYAPWLGTDANLIGQAGYAQVVDINGDGLSGLLSPFMHLDGKNQGYDGALNSCPANTLPCGFGVAYNASSNLAAHNVNAAPDLMTSATNGFGHYDAWDYYPLASGLIVNGVGLYRAPDLDDSGRYVGNDYFYFNSSMYVVGDYTASNGAGGANTHDFHYAQAIYNNQGRGFQGFRTVVDDDMASGARTVQVYHQRFPLSGQLAESWVEPIAGSPLTLLSPAPGPNIVDHVTNTAACFYGSGAAYLSSSSPHYQIDGVSCTQTLDAPTFMPYVSQSQEHKQDTAGNRLSDTTESYAYAPTGNNASYGNATEVDTTVIDDYGTYTTQVTDAFAAPNLSTWWLDHLQSKTATVHAVYLNTPDPGPVTRQTSYDSYDTGRSPTQVTSLPGDIHSIVTTYGYSSTGNPTDVTIAPGPNAPTMASRHTHTDYTTGNDANYFVADVVNPLGQTSYMTPDARFGEPKTVTAIDGVITTYTYDPFGRKITSQITSLPAQTIQYVTSSGNQDPNCAYTTAVTQYYVLVTQDGTPAHFSCYDMLNRVIRTGVAGFASESDDVYQGTNYDALGRVTGTTEPHYNNGSAPVIWNLNSYYSDILGRLQQRTDAKGIVTKYNYIGLETDINTVPPDSPQRFDVEKKNILGKTISVMNARGDATQATTGFTYDSDGNPLTITAADGSVIIATYNILDQKTQVQDPDQGTTSYSYDVLGELLQQTDAKSQTLVMTYDLLGRMLTKVSNVTGETMSTWCYDGTLFSGTPGNCTGSQAAPAIGKLSSVAQGDGSGYQETHTYDSLSRPSRDIETIGGTPYETDTSYDSDGRVGTVTYPASIADVAPVASAGSTQYVVPGALVTLNGSATDADGGPQPLDYQWSQTAGPAASLSSSTAMQPTFTASSTPGTSYTFQMVADDGLLASNTATVSVNVPGLPAAPTNLADDGDTDHNGSYLVSWHSVSVPGTTITYHLEEAGGTASGPTQSYSEIWSGTTVSHTVSHPGNGYYYYWYRVRAENKVGGNSVGYGPYSTTDNIHVVVAPGAPTTLNPSGLTGTTGPRVIFTWSTYTGPLPAADVFYQLLDSASNTFSPESVVYSGTALTYNMYVGTGAGDIYFHARACNTNGGVTACSGYTPSCHLIIAGGGSGNAPVHGSGTTTTAPPPTTNTGPTGSLLPDSLHGPLPELDPAEAKTAMALATPSVANFVIRPPGTVEMQVLQEQKPAGESRNPVHLIASTTHSGGSRNPVRPTFAPPLYQAWADAHLEPASGSTNLVGFSVQYQYTANGYLWKLVSGVDSNRIYWQENVFAQGAGANDASGNFIEHGMDARGNVAYAIYGNGNNAVNTHFGYDPNTGYLENINSSSSSTPYQNLCYTWQAIGNLVKRLTTSGDCTTAPNLKEEFTYDLLNRLKSSTVTNASGPHFVNYGYDSVGDITCKSDVTGNDCSTNPTGYAYGGSGSGAGPHAVSSTAGAVNGSYAYDANGNMTCRSYTTTSPCSPSTSNMNWDSDNMVTCIDPSSTSPSTLCGAGSTTFSQFSYAPDKHRYKQLATGSNGTETTLYVGGLEILTTSTGTEYRNTISAYGRPVMMDTLSTTTGGAPVETKHYLLTDHLGSVDTVVNDTGTTGSVAPLESFDAFGKRRDAGSWQGPMATADVTNARKVTHRGFTHHEHLDNLTQTVGTNTIDGLVDANGRMLDPVVGRFASVDPIYQAPTNSQSVNPYSYVMNNPLSLVDPTGYATCSINADSTCLTQGVNTVVNTDGSKQTVIVADKGDQVRFTDTSSGMSLKVTVGDNGVKSFNPEGVLRQAASDIGKSADRGKDDITHAAAKASACAYDGVCQLPSGYRATDADWYSQHSQKASLYNDVHAEAFESTSGGSPIIAFRGTTSWSELAADITQAMQGGGHQYALAMTLALGVRYAFGTSAMLTGHSLGGGEASAGSLITGIPAITFNASGLNPKTIAPYNASLSNAPSLIKAYYVRGDILTTLQSVLPIPGAVGTPMPLNPTLGDALEGPVHLHQMDSVLDSLGGN